MQLQTHIALVTADGIVAGKNVYTCSVAIKEQWFYKVLITGPFEVNFYIDPTDMERGFFFLNDVEEEYCVPIQREVWSADRMEAYYKKTQNIKFKYRVNGSGKIPNNGT